MNAWETLAADCDKSATKCGMCGAYGHEMIECQKYIEWHWEAAQQKPMPSPMWPGLMLLIGIAFVAFLFWQELAR